LGNVASLFLILALSWGWNLRREGRIL